RSVEGAHRCAPGTRAVGRGIGSRSMPPQSRAPATSAPVDRQYLLERVDDAAVVQVYADGFRDLALRERFLIWHLSQAAIAGRDIFYDQRYAHNLDMRDVLEAIVITTPGAPVSRPGFVGTASSCAPGAAPPRASRDHSRGASRRRAAPPAHVAETGPATRP